MNGERLFVEADNGMGSARGDVDDGFAIAALLLHGANVVALASTYGNVAEAEAAANNRSLVEALGAPVPLLRGAVRAGDERSETVDWLCAQREPLTVLALGPMTTIAAALARRPLPIGRIVLVGGDPSSRGRWPPLWPYEFNLRLDRTAAMRVFASDAPITVAPIDVGRRCLLSRDVLAAIPAPFGAFARRHAERWFARARRWFRADAIRVYDLVAAAVVLRPDTLRVVDTVATMHRRGWLEFGRGRPASVVRDASPALPELLSRLPKRPLVFPEPLTRP